MLNVNFVELVLEKQSKTKGVLKMHMMALVISNIPTKETVNNFAGTGFDYGKKIRDVDYGEVVGLVEERKISCIVTERFVLYNNDFPTIDGFFEFCRKWVKQTEGNENFALYDIHCSWKQFKYVPPNSKEQVFHS